MGPTDFQSFFKVLLTFSLWESNFGNFLVRFDAFQNPISLFCKLMAAINVSTKLNTKLLFIICELQNFLNADTIAIKLFVFPIVKIPENHL